LTGRFLQLSPDEKGRAISRLVASARVLTELLSKLMGASDDDPRPVYIAESGEEIEAD
jgi:hypothetical protein